MADDRKITDNATDKTSDSHAGGSENFQDQAREGMKDLAKGTKDYYEGRRLGNRDKNTQDLLGPQPTFFDSLDLQTERKQEPEPIKTESRSWYDDKNVVSKGENQYHDKVYFMADGRKVLESGDREKQDGTLAHHSFDKCIVGPDGRVESTQTKLTGGDVTREFKYDEKTGELSSFSENGAQWKKADDGSFVLEGSHPPQTRTDVSIDPESGVFRYKDTASGDKISQTFDGRTFKERPDGSSVETDWKGRPLYMDIPAGPNAPERRQISLNYNENGELTDYTENGVTWKRQELVGPRQGGHFGYEFVSEGKSRTEPKIDTEHGTFQSTESKKGGTTFDPGHPVG